MKHVMSVGSFKQFYDDFEGERQKLRDAETYCAGIHPASMARMYTVVHDQSPEALLKTLLKDGYEPELTDWLVEIDLMTMDYSGKDKYMQGDIVRLPDRSLLAIPSDASVLGKNESMSKRHDRTAMGLVGNKKKASGYYDGVHFCSIYRPMNLFLDGCVEGYVERMAQEFFEMYLRNLTRKNRV